MQKIKFFFQRLFKGYSDEDVWSFDSYFVKKMRKPFKDYVRHQEESGMSLPNEFDTDPAAWLHILKKIEFSFDRRWEESKGIFNQESLTHKELREEEQKIHEGFELFGRYLSDLWD